MAVDIPEEQVHEAYPRLDDQVGFYQLPYLGQEILFLLLLSVVK
jgi:hypothetical protein